VSLHSVVSGCDQCVVSPHVSGLYSLGLCCVLVKACQQMCRTVLSAYMHQSTWACVQVVSQWACALLGLRWWWLWLCRV
jgi:hypothetical protein